MYADHSEPFYEIPALIAINMIIAGASGGMVAIAIACWAQVKDLRAPHACSEMHDEA